jgi:hypothetical protein
MYRWLGRSLLQEEEENQGLKILIGYYRGLLQMRTVSTAGVDFCDGFHL